MSRDDIEELHRKLDALYEALSKSAEQRATMATELNQMCDCLKTLNQAVMGDNGIRARLTRVEGKVGVGQWVLLTLGTSLIGCLVAGIWTIAVRI